MVSSAKHALPDAQHIRQIIMLQSQIGMLRGWGLYLNESSFVRPPSRETNKADSETPCLVNYLTDVFHMSERLAVVGEQGIICKPSVPIGLGEVLRLGPLALDLHRD